MNHEFISVRAPKPLERFVWREAVSVIRRECPADGYESGNGSSGFSFQLVQSVRRSIVRLTETLETHKNSPRFGHGKSIHFGVHFETRSLPQRRKLFPGELAFKIASDDLEMESSATSLSSSPFSKL